MVLLPTPNDVKGLHERGFNYPAAGRIIPGRTHAVKSNNVFPIGRYAECFMRIIRLPRSSAGF